MLVKRIIKVPEKSKFVFERENDLKDDENSAFILSYQIGESKKIRVALAWLISFIKPKYFAELRTKQQLGKKFSLKKLKIFSQILDIYLFLAYSIFTYNKEIQGVSSLNFAIQSSKKPANYLAVKTYEFIDQVGQELQELSQTEFDRIKNGLIGQYQQEYQNIHEILNLLVRQISKGNDEFYIRENIVKEFEELTLDEVKKFFEKIFLEERRIVEFHLLSALKHEENEEAKKLREEENLEFFSDFDYLKRRCEVYPQFNAVML